MDSVKFRWHRGSLEESRNTEITVSSFDELYQIIKNDLSGLGIEVKKEDLEIRYYAYDNRIFEKSHIVTLKGFGVVGWTDSLLNQWYCVKCEDGFPKPTDEGCCPLCGSDFIQDQNGAIYGKQSE